MTKTPSREKTKAAETSLPVDGSVDIGQTTPDQNQPSYPELGRAYSETCGLIRHYSQASLSVRTATVAQGLILAIAWATAISKTSSLFTLFFPLAGLAFTFLLYHFNNGYFSAVEQYYLTAAKIEQVLLPEGCRAVARYESYHQQNLATTRSLILVRNAPFALTTVFFVVAAILSFVHWKLPIV